MRKLKLVEAKNKEALGFHYFELGLSSAINGEFSKASVFFKEGLDYVTCDCYLVHWNTMHEIEIENIYKDLEDISSNSPDYLFVKGLLLCFAEIENNLRIALKVMNKYILNYKDEYGYYIRGRIHEALDITELAIEDYYWSKTFTNSARINYRIGRIKEQRLNQYGIDKIYLSLLNNNSSACCARDLKRLCNKSSLDLSNDITKQNELITLFLEKEFKWIKFWSIYSDTYRHTITEDGICSEKVKKIADFISFLKSNENKFILKHTKIEEEDNCEDDYHSDYDSSSDVFNSPFYNENLDLDQQSQEFWDRI